MTDEFLDLMVELWTADEPVFDGEFFRLPAEPGTLKASPRPLQRPHPPIVVGGNRPPALRRAAKWQGWHPMTLPPESMASRLPVIDAELAAQGRSRADDGFRVHACLDLNLWTEPRDRPPRAPMHGTAEQLIDMIGRYAELGVTDLVLSGMMSDPATIPDAMERFATQVLPHVR